MNITTVGGRQAVVLECTTNYTNPTAPAAHGHSLSTAVFTIGDGLTLRKEGDIVVLSVGLDITDILNGLLAPHVKDMKEDIGALIERVDELEAE